MAQEFSKSLRLIASLVFLLFAGYALAGNTWTEKYLKRGLIFPGLVFSEDVKADLSQLVEDLKERIAEHPETRDVDELALADTYHWLGHIAEDEKDLTKSDYFHRESLEHYRKSSIKDSYRINDLNGERHSNWHIARIHLGVNEVFDVSHSEPGIAWRNLKARQSLEKLVGLGPRPDSRGYQSLDEFVVDMVANTHSELPLNERLLTTCMRVVSIMGSYRNSDSGARVITPEELARGVRIRRILGFVYELMGVSGP
jgi:hypothetical protein